MAPKTENKKPRKKDKFLNNMYYYHLPLKAVKQDDRAFRHGQRDENKKKNTRNLY